MSWQLSFDLLQLDTRWHDPATNRQRIETLTADARSDVLVLPEMFSTGFTMSAAEQSEDMDGPTVQWLRQLARTRQQTICGSAVIRQEGTVFNRLLWATPDSTLGIYDKRHLFRMAGEHHHYGAGTMQQRLNYRGAAIMPLICYDLRFPVWCRNQGSSIDILLLVANWPARRQRQWQALLRARAIENLCYVIGVNRVGTDGNGVAYGGGTEVFDFCGESLARDRGAEEMVQVTLSGSDLEAYRQEFPAHLDADTFVIGNSE